MTTQTDRQIAEAQRKTHEVLESARKQRPQLVRQTSLADIQQRWRINIRTPADACCQMATNVATALDINGFGAAGAANG